MSGGKRTGAGAKKKPVEEKLVQFDIRMRPSKIDELQKMADKKETKRSAYVRNVLNNHIDMGVIL